MKTVAFLFLAALVVLAVAGPANAETKTVDAGNAQRQRQEKVLYLLESIGHYSKDADWFKLGHEYDVEANIDKYTDKKAVEKFLVYYRRGFMPKDKTFSASDDQMRDEAIVLFNLFYSAKDFDTFYQTAAFARVYFNVGEFLYAYYIAIYQRPDTNTLVLPDPYKKFPQYFVRTS